MIAVDTSILNRYFVQDDPGQAALATSLLEQRLTPGEPGLITVVAIAETAWVLQRVYRQSWEEVRPIIAGLLDAPNLVVEHHREVAKALAATAGFADALIHYIGGDLGADSTFTFDKKFARLESVELLKE